MPGRKDGLAERKIHRLRQLQARCTAERSGFRFGSQQPAELIKVGPGRGGDALKKARHPGQPDFESLYAK